MRFSGRAVRYVGYWPASGTQIWVIDQNTPFPLENKDFLSMELRNATDPKPNIKFRGRTDRARSTILHNKAALFEHSLAANDIFPHHFKRAGEIEKFQISLIIIPRALLEPNRVQDEPTFANANGNHTRTIDLIATFLSKTSVLKITKTPE